MTLLMETRKYQILFNYLIIFLFIQLFILFLKEFVWEIL